MTKALYSAAFLLGAAVILWIAGGFVGTDMLALMVTLIIGVVYVIGAVEQWQFRQVTNSLTRALQQIPAELSDLAQWLKHIHPTLQNSVRLRVEGERLPLPGPVLTPYLVGLLVMLGLLGTFVGMVVTLQGAVLALEGTTELQAIRAGLARPIEGLGLAFGTSVAGVAASAMLGLISTLNRRDRMLATRELDSRVANELKNFSLVHHRQETFKALQNQSTALPEVAQRLADMAGRIEAMGSGISQALLENQQSFQSAVTDHYQRLAESVEKSLHESLASSSREASAQVAPVIEAAMEQLAQQADATQQTLVASLEEKIAAITVSLQGTSEAVARAWQGGVEGQQQSQAALLDQVASHLSAYQDSLRQESAALISGFEVRFSQWHELQSAENTERASQWQALQESWLAHFRETAGAMVAELATSWREASSDGAHQQQEIINAMVQASERLTETASTSAELALEKVHGLVATTEQLLDARMQTEQEMVATLKTQSAELLAGITARLESLHDAEVARGAAAVDRLSELENVVAQQLATLGSALETPMTRLIETATEAPKAAALVIEQLRAEVSRNLEKDNDLLQERTRIMAELDQLLTSLEATSQAQREAIETLISNSSSTLDKVGARFTENVAHESDRLAEVADQFVGSVSEIASLGEAFNASVVQFSEANQSLIENLVRIEAAMEQAGNRSDEQLAYYVAQAREIIDHNIMAQKDLFEQLRQLAPQDKVAEGEVS